MTIGDTVPVVSVVPDCVCLREGVFVLEYGYRDRGIHRRARARAKNKEYETKADIYKEFSDYCTKAGFATPTDSVFFRDLKKEISYQNGSKTINKQRIKILLGIKMIASARGVRDARGLIPNGQATFRTIGNRVRQGVHPVHPMQESSETDDSSGHEEVKK